MGGGVMTVRKTISLTDQHDTWIKVPIASGDYASDSEYVRDLIRRDKQECEKFQTLKKAIQDGLDSGISDRNVKDIMVDVEQRLKVNGKLPSN
jgi:antitoxin ParD1/3/4